MPDGLKQSGTRSVLARSMAFRISRSSPGLHLIRMTAKVSVCCVMLFIFQTAVIAQCYTPSESVAGIAVRNVILLFDALPPDRVDRIRGRDACHIGCQDGALLFNLLREGHPGRDQSTLCVRTGRILMHQVVG